MPKIKHIRINDIRYDLSTTIRNVDGLREELDKQNSDILEIQNDLEGVHGDLDGIHEDLDKKAEEILVIQNDLDGIHGDLDKKSGEILKIQGDLGDIQDDIDTKYDDYMGTKRVVLKHEDDIEGLGHEIDDLKKEIDELPDGGGGGSVTEVVPVTLGGTGKTSVTANNFLVGNGQSTLQEKTPAQVLTLIGGASASEVEDLKTSVSDGKSAIASAITDKGVSTSGSDSFEKMAENIAAIEVNSSDAPSDGKKFTRCAAMPTGYGYARSIAYGKDKFIIIATERVDGEQIAAIAYSTDGVNWEKANYTLNITDSQYDLLRCVCYGGDCFVALGQLGVSPMYSTSGSSWTTLYQVSLPCNIHAVAYGAGHFVAVGESQNIGTNNRVGFISDNGRSWETLEYMMPDVASEWNAITYGGGHFVAVGNNSAIVSSNSGKSFESTLSSLPSNINWMRVAYGNGIFIATGYDKSYTFFIAKSINGVSWNIVKRMEGDGLKYRAVVWGNGKFIIFGCNTNSIMYSINGSEWTTVENALPGEAVVSCAWGNGMFVCTSSEIYNAYSRTTNDY